MCLQSFRLTICFKILILVLEIRFNRCYCFFQLTHVIIVPSVKEYGSGVHYTSYLFLDQIHILIHPYV